jgi:hypothetical protein
VQRNCSLTSSVTCHDHTILVFQGNDRSTSHIGIPVNVKKMAGVTHVNGLLKKKKNHMNGYISQEQSDTTKF